MTTLNKEHLIASGGKLWGKDNLERVYLDDAAIAKAFDLKLVDDAKWAGEFISIGKAKVWFNCKKNTLHSDVGTVRVMFNQNGIKCAK